MKQKKLTKIFSGLFLLIFVLACGLPSSQPAPTAAVTPLGTAIAQTAAAAQTFTAYKISLYTPTPTTTGTKTPSLSPTPTITFDFSIFAEKTSTSIVPVETIDLTLGESSSSSSSGSSGAGNGTSVAANPIKTTDQLWSCTVIARSPSKGTTVKPDKDIYVSWTIVNTGTRSWPENGIDFVYDAGYGQEGRAIQDFSRSVPKGGKITLKILVHTPKTEETYNVIWSLKVGNTKFCHMKATFTVKK